MSSQHPQTNHAQDQDAPGPDGEGGPRVPEDAFDLEELMALTLAPLELAEADEEADLAPWQRTHIPKKSFLDLQWSQLIDELLEGTVSPEGRVLAMGLAPLEDAGAVRRRMREIAECQELLSRDEAPPLRGLSNIRQAVAYAKRGGVLVAEDLYAIARNCDVASRAARYYHHRAETSPYLSEAAAGLDACDELRHALNHAVEPGGRLSDKASPDLGRLRRSVQSHKDRLSTRVDQLLQSQDMEPSLQDDYFKVREGRYVLPIRVGAKGAVDGIVHGYSSSGQTAYIEPDELIELNNKLRWAQIELEEEIERILKRLSGLVSRFAEPLTRSMNILAYMDLILAAARLGQRLASSVPELTEASSTSSARATRCCGSRTRAPSTASRSTTPSPTTSAWTRTSRSWSSAARTPAARRCS